MVTFIKQSFNWKPGLYKIRFLIDSPTKITIKNDIYSFELTTFHIEDLEENKEQINKSYEQLYSKYLESEKEEEKEKLIWHWSYPLIKKSS